MIKEHKIILIFLIAIIAIIISLIVITRLNSVKSPLISKDQLSSDSTKKTRIFRSSSAMKFSAEIPNKFNIKERFGSVILTTDNGEILIGQNGTNFDNLKDFINNHPHNLALKLKNQQDLAVNGLEGMSGYIDDTKNYFIYADYTVYFLSTSSEELYADLDQIAQSFRYTP